MNISEEDFIELNKPIKIIPNFNQDSIHLVTETIGPFRAGLPLDVPIWLALFFNSQNKCSLVEPTWLETDNLENIITEEKHDELWSRNSHADGMRIQSFFMNKTERDSLSVRLMQIEDLRLAKLRKSIDSWLGPMSKLVVTLPNVSFNEYKMLRCFDLHVSSLPNVLFP